MAKRPVTFTGGADARPRIHFRIRGNQPQVAGTGAGPWQPCSDIVDGIDLVAGEDAYRTPAVIIWEGVSHDA